MNLGGPWRAAESNDDLRRAFADVAFDDTEWEQLPVPGHWRSHPAFETSDGPVLYRRRFVTNPPVAGRRTFLTFDGIFYQGDVWLDGEYVGDTEGYFFPHTFEVTAAMTARRDHVLAIEVACSRPSHLSAKKNLTGIFQHWDCIDPDWNPGGVWAPARIEETGPVRIRSLKVLCRDATDDAATLDLEASLDTLAPCIAIVRTAARREGTPPGGVDEVERLEEHTLAAGVNQVRWRLTIEHPELWWPHALGSQPLYEVDVAVHLQGPDVDAAAHTEHNADETGAAATVEVASSGAPAERSGSSQPASPALIEPAPPAPSDATSEPSTATVATTEQPLPANTTPSPAPATPSPAPALAPGLVATASDPDPAPVPADPAEISDRRVLTTGLRQIRVRNFIATVNGERLFLKGANCGPTRRALAEATCEDLAGDVTLGRQAGLDLVRVHAHITRPEFYDAADRQGMLIWQDLPLQWGYGQVRRQAVVQARRAVSLLGHHPSVALWCGHNEPLALDRNPASVAGPRRVARIVAGQVLPSWNKTALDRSVRRALERADGSREVIAHSGIWPHPAWGTDSHLYFGWYYGQERDLPSTLARFPVLARFVSEFGAQAVPDDAGFMHPERWPNLDWDDLAAHHGLQRAIFEQRVPPGRSPTFEAWRFATQDYQATLLRHHIETLRRLKYRPAGGFCLFLLADAQPAVSWSVLDHTRQPKAGYQAVVAACAPVIVTAERPEPTYRPRDRLLLDLHAVSDLRRPLTDVLARAVVRWPGGEKRWRFTGDVPADSCVRLGRIDLTLPESAPVGPIDIELVLRWDTGQAENAYRSRLTAGP